MKKSIFLIIALMFTMMISKAQTVMQINGADCNGMNHDLYADLDSGKAVIVFFWMPSCGSCPPPAQKIQKMANNVMATYPNKVTAYAMPFNNSTSCATSASWTSTNSLPLFMPYDSGATQVANYGGFGMPTVVLLGGKAPNRRVMFSTLSFATSDTTIMRDSIINILKSTTATLSMDCPNITTMGTLTKGQAASGVMIHIPYTYNITGNTYAQSTATSTGVTGLTAKLTAGTFSSSGNFRFDVSGTPSASGNATFNLTVSGQSCSYKFAVANNGGASINGTNADVNLNHCVKNNQACIISDRGMNNAQITITDIQGKTILNKTLNLSEGLNTISNPLNKGIYLMNIQSESVSQSFKFAIE